jgi:Tol biopolymer transport system component
MPFRERDAAVPSARRCASRGRLQHAWFLAAVVAAVGLVQLVWVAVGAVVTEDTVLVSRASHSSSLSADGRFAAFTSSASNLDPDDGDSISDVFVRDLETGMTTLVSRASGAASVKGNGDSRESSISADGRFVVFASEASNLDPDDSEGLGSSAPLGPTLDVFLRDLQTNTTVRVSRTSGADGADGNGGSFEPSVSRDGRFVAFSSTASNLDPDDRDENSDVFARADVFVRDLDTNRTVLASRASGVDGAKGNDASREPSLSADGRFVAFTSMASNLDPDDAYTSEDVFVRDLQASSTEVVSRRSGPAGAVGSWGAGGPSISSDGRFVAFTTWSSLAPADGEVMGLDVYARDLQTDTTTLASRASGARGAKGDSDSTKPSLSADGRLVAFESAASNLHPYDSNTNRASDVFVRDLQIGTTVLVSRASGPAGVAGNDSSMDPSISADGRVVAFSSDASNLDPDDRDSPDLANRGVFVRQIGLPPLSPPPRRSCQRKRARIVVLPGSGPVVDAGIPSRSDVIFGSNGADRIDTGPRDDRICARGGGDRIRGGDDRDRLVGGSGDDRILGGRHDDLLHGGVGNDLLDGGAGHDRILAGGGNDFIPTAGRFADRVDCGPGYDRVIVDPLDHVRRCESVRMPKPHGRP